MREAVRAFTLIELLVVIALVAVLCSLAYAGAGVMIGRTHAVQCLSSVRRVGAAMHMFAADNGGRFPGTVHGVSWTNSLASYLGGHFIGKCPCVPEHRARVTYAWNDSLADSRGEGVRVVSCRTPEATMVLAESANNYTGEHFHFAGLRGGAARVTPNQFKASVNVEAHYHGANYLFVDGHAENLAWSEVQRRLTSPATTFIVP